jgi:hypothetical protein
VYGLAVSRSRCGCENIGWLNVGQNRIVIIWTGCISVIIRCEGMSRLYLGQDRGVREWAGYI